MSRIRSIFQTDSKLVTALCALRVAIDLWLKGLDFGVTTSDPGPFRVFSHRCYKRSTASGYFFQNVLGCIFMAAIARHKKAMNQHLATGLASGLCGSLTTWATWMGEVAATIINGFVFQAFVSVMCMLCVSLSSYRLGHFLAGCGMEDEPKCFDEYCGLRILFSHEEKRADDSEEDDSSDDGNGATPEDEEWGLQVDHPASWREPERKEVFLSDAVHIAIVAIAFVIIALSL
eukprot:s1953_g1.t1